MAGLHRIDVQKCERMFVFVNFMGGNFAFDDLGKNCFLSHNFIIATRKTLLLGLQYKKYEWVTQNWTVVVGSHRRAGGDYGNRIVYVYEDNRQSGLRQADVR